MAQLPEYPWTSPIPYAGAPVGRSAGFVLIGLIIIMVVAATSAFVAKSVAPSVASASNQDEVIDGWLPGITAANASRRIQEANASVDGYLPALTAANEGSSPPGGRCAG